MSELKLRAKMTGKKTVAAKDPSFDLPKIVLSLEIALDDTNGDVNRAHDIHQLEYGCGYVWYLTMEREQKVLPTLEGAEDANANVEEARLFPVGSRR